MVFSEPFFLFFFLPIILTIYFLTPARGRNVVLSLASLVFYAASEWGFLGWLVTSIAVNYWIGRGIERTRGTPWSKRLLAIGIVSDLSLLVVFKYGGFLTETLNAILVQAGVPLFDVPHLLLPLGISFFTFHKISYKVDVYRGDAEARKAPFDLALYILLFPQLIAGPIVRYHEIADEIVRRVYTRADFAEGIRRFVTGMGKKLIIADTVGVCADRVFALPGHEVSTSLAWLGVVCYTLQIYFDFSGYSDMAIGLARMFGFHFPENFNYPYISGSITEFWRRWHMSLSRWFRDYLYIPLGGNRRGPAHTYVNLVTVFFFCGLWHGASWLFVIWGMFHGLLLVVERVGFGRLLGRTWRPLSHVYALLMVMIGWVLFRSRTLDQAWQLLTAMAGLTSGRASTLSPAEFLNRDLAIALAIGVLGSTPILSAWRSGVERIRRSLPGPAGIAFDVASRTAGVACFAGLLLYASTIMASGTYSPFIYFRF